MGRPKQYVSASPVVLVNRVHYAVAMRQIYVVWLAIAWISGITAQIRAEGGPCPRPAVGSAVPTPPDLYSRDGLLTVDLSYNTARDAAGRTLYCFTTPSGAESPTLHVQPGDRLIVKVKNNLPVPAPSGAMRMGTNAPLVCGAHMMDSSSVNLHYHGLNIPPTCHSDEVIYTMINSGQTFTYDLAFPDDEPPGLYWYHPHVHGLSEAAVQGGASGAIVVEGIENVQPAVAGLPQRLLIVRDQIVPGAADPDRDAPGWDLSLNYVPISYPAYTPAVLHTTFGEPEFWRLLNASADTILDIEVVYDGAPQTLMLAGVDGVPTGSQDGAKTGTLIPITHLRLPPASRAEFIVRTPTLGVRSAQFRTRKVNTGPDGDHDPARPLAAIVPDQPRGAVPTAAVAGPPQKHRFGGLATAAVTAIRKLYFSEKEERFFMTVEGQIPRLYSPDNPPAIVTTQGSVEDWTIENRTRENHSFHIHQIHFLVLAQDHFEVNGSQPTAALQGQMADMIDVPFWDGNPRHPYPRVTLRMDFRGPATGDFVYHCHILEHEDKGMMAIVRVLPAAPSSHTRP
jgi:FtsP/CotA-like multicopper oxidase with cupredoxin domain